MKLARSAASRLRARSTCSQFKRPRPRATEDFTLVAKQDDATAALQQLLLVQGRRRAQHEGKPRRRSSLPPNRADLRGGAPNRSSAGQAGGFPMRVVQPTEIPRNTMIAGVQIVGHGAELLQCSAPVTCHRGGIAQYKLFLSVLAVRWFPALFVVLFAIPLHTL
jgi:hypothetical protein